MGRLVSWASYSVVSARVHAPGDVKRNLVERRHGQEAPFELVGSFPFLSTPEQFRVGKGEQCSVCCCYCQRCLTCPGGLGLCKDCGSVFTSGILLCSPGLPSLVFLVIRHDHLQRVSVTNNGVFLCEWSYRWNSSTYYKRKLKHLVIGSFGHLTLIFP